MKIIFFSTKSFDKPNFDEVNKDYNHKITYTPEQLHSKTVSLAKGSDCVCVFGSDTIDKEVIQQLHTYGITLIARRGAGYDNIDLEEAKNKQMTVIYAPQYSPNAIAEHAVALMLILQRKLNQAIIRTRNNNFSIDGLLGATMQGKTVGVIGTGKIGIVTAKILRGMDCKVIAYDIIQNPICAEMGIRYVPIEELYENSDIVTLHCPLTPENHHLIETESIKKMKKGVMLINTARGGLIDTPAVLAALKEEQVGSLGIDVYAREKGVFFADHSQEGITDKTLQSLLSLPNVVVTSHQGFFTKEAIQSIAETILSDISLFEKGKSPQNRL